MSWFAFFQNATLRIWVQKVYLKCDSRNIERAVERGDRRAINKRCVIKPVTTEQLGLSPTGNFWHIPQFRYPGSNEVGVMVPPPRPSLRAFHWHWWSSTSACPVCQVPCCEKTVLSKRNQVSSDHLEESAASSGWGPTVAASISLGTAGRSQATVGPRLKSQKADRQACRRGVPEGWAEHAHGLFPLWISRQVAPPCLQEVGSADWTSHLKPRACALTWRNETVSPGDLILRTKEVVIWELKWKFCAFRIAGASYAMWPKPGGNQVGVRSSSARKICWGLGAFCVPLHFPWVVDWLLFSANPALLEWTWVSF